MSADDRRLYLFDDARADAWAPFSLTRPVGELLFGRWRLRERIARFAGARVDGHLTRRALSRFAEAGAAAVIAPDAVPDGQTRLLWSSRAVPELSAAAGREPANLWVGDALAGVVLAPGVGMPDAGWLADPGPLPDLPDLEVAGAWLAYPWDLVSRGPDRLAADLSATLAEGMQRLPDGVWRLGEAPLALGSEVRLEPGVVLDTRAGPIELANGVEVRTGARLAGPLYAGPGTRLLGGSISRSSAGPMSYLRGEIEDSTVLGYTNKAHDGFLGHAYVGSWVNLGALTTNSDLKNNYGSIRVGPPGETVDTRLTKLGCLIGDHVKTGIGVMLNTGTVIGAGSNVFGSEMPPKWIAPFSWGSGDRFETYRREAFLDTAGAVMPRRGIEPDGPVLGWLGDVWDAAREENG